MPLETETEKPLTFSQFVGFYHQAIEPRFERIEQRLDRMGERFQVIDERFDDLYKKFEDLHTEYIVINEQLRRLGPPIH